MGTHIVYAKPKNTIPDSLQILRFEVNTIPFSMQRVEGGLFVMGGTREQHREEISTELLLTLWPSMLIILVIPK